MTKRNFPLRVHIKINLKENLNMIKKSTFKSPEGIRIKYIINLSLFTFTFIRFIK